MNALATSRAADGFDRISWTVADILGMQAAGFIDEDANFELWEGEIVPMNAKYNRHELWKRNVIRLLIRALPEEIAVSVEPSVFS